MAEELILTGLGDAISMHRGLTRALLQIAAMDDAAQMKQIAAEAIGIDLHHSESCPLRYNNINRFLSESYPSYKPTCECTRK